MARLIFPTDFASQKKLSEAIFSKHNNDGANSIIKTFMVDNEIDPAKFATKADAANKHEEAREFLFGQSTKYTQLRDVLMKQPTSNFKSCVQTLKKHYKSAPHKLSDWGITVEGAAKVVYPTKFIGMSSLMKNFADKHLTMTAGTSPLDNFLAENEIDLAKDKAEIVKAIAYDTDADKKAEESAKETELLNVCWQPVAKQLKDIGQYLLTVFTKTPRKASDWGFAINESPTAAKEINTKIKLGDKATLSGVIIGGTLKNTGTTDLHIYKGNKIIGNPIIIHAGESFGIQKGYSTITICNPSNTTEANISTLRSR
jgi:hypothetical protein